VTLGVVSRTRWLVAAGGSAFLLAFVLLAWIVWRSWRRSIVRRHPVPVIAYGIALTSLLLGAGLGASLALGWAGQRYIGWRQAHLVLNVLGFASLTIVGTMLTLLPTVLRVRMSQRRGGAIVGLLGVGAAGLAFGAIAGEASPATIGAVAYVAGATTFVILVGSILRNERRWAVPVAGFHMVSGVGWFAIGSIWLAIAVARDQPMGRAFLDVFVLGWVVQVLIGAWSYLLPMMRPGDPGKHRSGLHALEVGGRTQVALLNAGVALLVMSDLGWWRGDMVGSLLAFAALAFALAKAWLLPVLDRLPTGPRARAVWG
jgi:nitrite reductase (NO-forming)